MSEKLTTYSGTHGLTVKLTDTQVREIIYALINEARDDKSVFDVLQDALEALDVVHETRARERERWRGSTAVILRALPLCPGEYTKTPIVRDGTVIGHSGHFAGCGKVATWGLLGEACDEHRATKMLELPYAAELRALLALLEAK